MSKTATKKVTLTDPQGQALLLGRSIGRGGEGEVFALAGRPDTLVKLYHQPMSRERAGKIEALAGLATPGLAAVCALPKGLVRRGGEAVGFLMPFLPGRRELHELHGPQSRCARFPAAGFAFLVHVASNIARAFAVLHEAGILVGDVNDRGVLVGDDATVRLIDCDSFQVTTPRRTYPCVVGVPGFTPPELQGVNLRDVVRSERHDCFGIAVLLFLLVCMGRHPFAGSYGKGPIELEKAIAECRYAYSRDTARTLMEPPPKTLPLASLVGAEIADLFEEAFSPAAAAARGRPRPSARTWISALDRLAQGLTGCPLNGAHAHVSGLASCPWCQLEQLSGTDLFAFVMTPAAMAAKVDIEAIWSAVALLAVPAVPDPMPQARAEALARQTPSLHHRRRAELEQLTEEARRARKFASACSAQAEREARALNRYAVEEALEKERIAALEVAVSRRRKAAVSWLVAVATVLGSSIRARREARLAESERELDRVRAEAADGKARRAADVEKQMAIASLARQDQERALQLADAMESRARALRAEVKAERRKAVAEADSRLAEATRKTDEGRRSLEALKPVADSLRRHLDATRAGLAKLRSDWHALERDKAAALKQLHATVLDHYRTRHLASHFIANATIRGITPALKASLASFGIETAADVNETAVGAVPGFGPVRTRAMVDWRIAVARRFRAPASLEPDPQQIRTLEQRFLSRRRDIERHFPKAKAELERQISALATRIAQAKAQADDAVRLLAQARIDRRSL